jgi:dTDP-glucose pyrophosphorylase
VQPQLAGLCDAIFQALPLIQPHEPVVIGLPDTIWFPEDGLRMLPDDALSFLLFPVQRPELFDAVLTDGDGAVREIRVKQNDPGSHWIWGAFKMPGAVLHQLYELWRTRGERDAYIGTLINAYLDSGGAANAVRAGRAYVDVGTLNGYREAMWLLNSTDPHVRAESRNPNAAGLPVARE